MMVVHPNETNTFDQRWLEYHLWQKHHIRLIRRSLADVAERAVLGDSRRQLVIDDLEVGISYFRAGYTPDDYPSEKEWAGRLIIERSSSIKCPSISHHLAGAKKIQQQITVPGVLERFVSAETAKSLRECFTGLYSLTEGEPGVADAIAAAVASPEKYVLKPQREGGGNNFYGENLRHQITTLSPSQLSAFILMDRIVPPDIPTYMLREKQLVATEGNSELGIYGVFVSKGDTVLMNNFAGHLLRTKAATTDEGGVAAGFAVLDSPYLV
eukprot:TRINITY_DN4808_c0_g1_i1.p1 TRINITY_DN4808_c0_g1~~TRINITY_DN4808_c0_g1_i1.p1  ORF type:complete len:269 (-),score=21.96 TRINITY_DN4808_c0_g1_i1:5-811(-)